MIYIFVDMVKTWTKKHCDRQTLIVIAQQQNSQMIPRKTQAVIASWYAGNEGKRPTEEWPVGELMQAYILQVKIALERLAEFPLHDSSPDTKMHIERLFVAIHSLCTRFAELLPYASKDEKMSVTNFTEPMTLGAVLDVFEKLCELDTYVRFPSKIQTMKMALRVLRCKRAEAKREGHIMFPLPYAYSPKWMLELFAGAPILPFLGVPLFGREYLHTVYQQLSWCAIDHDLCIHGQYLIGTESFRCRHDVRHVQLRKLVDYVNVRGRRHWRDILFLIGHETWDFVWLFNDVARSEQEAFVRTGFVDTPLVHDRVRMVSVFIKQHRPSFNFDSTTQVNSRGVLGYQTLADMFYTMLQILELS